MPEEDVGRQTREILVRHGVTVALWVLGYLAAAEATVRYATIETAAPVWFPGGIAVAAVWRNRGHWRWVVCVGLALAWVPMAGRLGISLLEGALVGLVLTVRAGLIVVVLERIAPGSKPLATFRGVVTLTAAALFATPPVAGLVAAVLAPHSGVFATGWGHTFGGLTLGTIGVAPALLLTRPVRIPPFRWRNVMIVLAALAGSIWLFDSSDAPSPWRGPYLVVPALLWTAWSFSTHGAAIGNALLAIIATAGAVRGLGPFVAVEAQATSAVQLFLVVTSITALGLAALLKERDAAAEQARAKDRLYQVLADNLPHGFAALFDNRGACLLASGGALPANACENAETMTPVTAAGRNAVEGTPFRGHLTIGDARTYQIEAIPLVGKVAGVAAMVVGLDVTDQVAAEAELRRRETLLQAIIDNMPDAVLVHDLEGRVQAANPAAARLAGVDAGSVRGSRIADWIAIEDRERVEQSIDRARQGQPCWVENQFISADGESHTLLNYLAPLTTPAGDTIGIAVLSRNVTADRQAVARLRETGAQFRQLAHLITETREAERAALAREIHDALGQALTGLAIDVDWLGERGLDAAGATQRLVTMRQSIGETLETVRRIAADLRPAILDDLGLASAVEWQVRTFAERLGIGYTVQVDDELPGLSGEIATAVFRVLQEALTNVARHARASRVDVELTLAGPTLCLTVTNDGQPFDLAAVKGGGAGILGMRERMATVGGTLTIEPGPLGQGARVTVQVPVLSEVATR